MTKTPLLAGTILLLTWSSVQGQRRDVCPTNVGDIEIVEAVFRYQLQQSIKERKWNLFYLAFGWDPSEQTEACVERWVDAFKDHASTVKKFSRNGFDAERINKERGRVLGVAEVKRKTETEAEVEGYIFVVPGEAQGYRYLLMRENGKWIVKASKGTWIARLKANQKREEVVGTLIAYDRYSGLCVAPLASPCKEYFVIRIDRGEPLPPPSYIEPLPPPSYIKVANILKDRRPSKEFYKGGKWRLLLERDEGCDGVDEFAYMVVNGKYVFTRPRWRTIVGGDQDRLPLGRAIPCYTLKSGNRIPSI